jgi:hypothetical protein
MKKIVFAALLGVLLIPMVAAAQVDHSGKWALGYWDPAAPIGIRYTFSPKMAVDFAVGFATAKVTDYTSTDLSEATKVQFHFEAGFPITLAQKDKVNFFFRPGVLVKMIPYYFSADDGVTVESKTATDFAVSGILGVEWFPVDDFSLSVGHGIQVVSSKGVSLGEPVGPTEPKSETTFNGLQGLDVTKIGFHYYF